MVNLLFIREGCCVGWAVGVVGMCLRTKVAGNRGQWKDIKGHKLFSPFSSFDQKWLIK